MKHRGWMGALVIGICIAAASGCSSGEPAQRTVNPSKPIASARVRSSALTKKVTGSTAWRIYQGRTQLVVMGFAANGAPMDGVRVRYAARNESRRWAVSFESLKNGGVLQIGANGKVVAQTMSDADVKVLFGATRVLRAWSQKRAAAGSVVPKSIQSFSDGVDCAVSGAGAIRDCAPVVARCVRWGTLGGTVGGARGAGAAVLTCLAWNWRQTATCAAGTYDAAKNCYDAWNSRDQAEQQNNPEPEGSADGKPKPGGDSESGDPEASRDPESEESTPDESATSDAEEPDMEAEAAAEDPEAPLEDQVDESESYSDEYDSNPADPEEEAIAEGGDEGWSEDESSEDYATDDSSSEESEEYASEEESSDDIETESFRAKLVPKTASKRSRGGACADTRVLHCGARPKTAFCRCVKS